ncbi:hypothetical protein VTN49DRAFT_7455 [Thermomyces lanuginosus]|uniref:uncharacterized protein n=1 Tax=Thermomyces lanuginosus TaxID=5541 RepID=UPI0037439458
MPDPRGGERSKPRGMRRDRDCRSCRARNIKCDLNRPRCLPCVQAGLACGNYPKRLVWVGETTIEPKTLKVKQRRISSSKPKAAEPSTNTPTLSSSSATSAAQSGAGSSQSPTTPGGQDANQHSFFRSLAALCQEIVSGTERDVRDDRHLSADTLELVKSLHDLMRTRFERIPLSGTDGGGRPPEVTTTTKWLEVLGHVNEALKTANPFAILGIATFAVFDVCDGPFGNWVVHLRGAKSLLDKHCRNWEEIIELSHTIKGLVGIVARLVWFDTIGAIVRGTTGLIFEDWHLQAMDDGFFRVMGCPADTFRVFVHIAKAGVVSDPWGSCFMAMEQLSKLDANPTEWGRCTNAYRCTAVLAILNRLPDKATASIEAKQATVESTVDRLCDALASVSPTSPYYIHLATPAFLAGRNATNIRHCTVVRAYWQNCTLSDVPRYPDGLSACEEVWRKKGLM